MKAENVTPVLALAEAMIAGLHEKNNNFTVVKHYDTFTVTAQDAALIQERHPELAVFYYRYSGADMTAAYEPVPEVIRGMYHRFYSHLSVEDYIGLFDVYPLHRSLFVSMVRDGVCRREEELILDEVNFEQDKLLQSMTAILLALSSEHPILLVADNLNMASHSALRLFDNLFAVRDNSGFLIYAAYNDLHPVPPHVSAAWESVCEKWEDHNCVLEGGISENVQRTDEGSSFCFESARIHEYLLKLNNMYQLLDLEQAKYYLDILYQKIELEKLSLNADCVFNFYRLYALVSLYSNDIANALICCDHMQQSERDDFDADFWHAYILGMARMYGGRLREARSCALRCRQLAEGDRRAYELFRAQMLEVMVRMSGWHNIFFCKSDTEVDAGLLERAVRYHYENHLAYIYIYAFDNDIALFSEENVEENRLPHFEKGVELAKKLKNERLLLAAYRKNIMLSSAHGMFAVANHYHYKSMEIVGDRDPVRLADIYNGLGYNNCAAEQYEEAHSYYNRAIVIFYRLGLMNYVGETLYNMAINCILAGEYQSAYDDLQNCMKIVITLHLNDLRVCNISKIYGLLALCAYRLKLFYNCRLYLDNALQFLRHILNRENASAQGSLDLSYTACDDDIFLYYYVEALLRMEEKKFPEALLFMDKAQIYMERSVGNQFFSRVQFSLSLARLYRAVGREADAEEILRQGIAYAEACGNKEKVSMLRHALSGEETAIRHEGLHLEGVTLEEIQAATRQVGIAKNYAAQRNQMEFLSVWQNLLEIDGRTADEMVSNALNTFLANFSMDEMLYLRYIDGRPTVCFDTRKTLLTEEQAEVITDYFSRYHTGFVTSRLRKSHVECSRILSLFGEDGICSMICLPYYVNEKLDSVFLMYINMKDNWSSPLTKYMLDESEYRLFHLMMRQLVNAVEMAENEEEIRRINSELEKSAITDYLTGLYNRNGFYGRLHTMLESGRRRGSAQDFSFLYIDLDNFKYYNDTFGHDVGDMIIEEVAQILREAAGRDGFATRFGGDEFLVTLTGADEEEAVAVGRRILEALKARNSFADGIERMMGEQVRIPDGKQVSCSVGIARAVGAVCEEDISEAIRRADEMLYEIKHSTKGDVRI